MAAWNGFDMEAAIELTFDSALIFAEDLMTNFLRNYCQYWSPSTSGHKRRRYLPKWYTENILRAVDFFAGKTSVNIHCFPNVLLDLEGRYIAKDFPYNPRSFLEYCGEVCAIVLLNYENTTEPELAADMANNAVVIIAKVLQRAMISGEFERSGGWNSLQTLAWSLAHGMTWVSSACTARRCCETACTARHC